MILRKKKKKGIKLNYRYQKRHSIYCVVGIIILILLSFLVRNFGNCKIYSLNINEKDYYSNNGLLILMKNKTILKLSDINYKGKIENVKTIELALCVEVDDTCKEIYTRSLKAKEGINYRYSLGDMIVDVYNDDKHSEVFTRKVKREIRENLYLTLYLLTEDDKDIYVKVPVNAKEEYANNKLF